MSWFDTKLSLARSATRVVVGTGIYYSWSKVYRRIFEKWHIGRTLRVYASLEVLLKEAADMEWRSDKWYMLGDAISHPHAVWWRYLNKEPAGDCDDISIFILQGIVDLGLRGYMPRLREARLLTVPWMENRTRKVKGHNVCAWSERTDRGTIEWKHVSNWFDAQPCGPFPTWQAAAKHVVKFGDNSSLGAAMCSIDLRLTDWANWRKIENA